MKSGEMFAIIFQPVIPRLDLGIQRQREMPEALDPAVEPRDDRSVWQDDKSVVTHASVFGLGNRLIVRSIRLSAVTGGYIFSRWLFITPDV